MVRKTTIAGEIDTVCSQCADVGTGGVESLHEALNGMEYAGLALMIRQLHGQLIQLTAGGDAERVAWDTVQTFAGEPVAHYLLQALGRNRLLTTDRQLKAAVPVSLQNAVAPIEVLTERFLGDAIERYQVRMAALGVGDLL